MLINVNGHELKDLFLLDPEVAFLNHGSFGACPKSVFETFHQWQLRLEKQPVLFLGRQADDFMDAARAELGKYINASAEDIIFVPNATVGINTVARSLDLREGDEILATNHEYGAMNNVWEYICSQSGAKYVQRDIPLPVTTTEAFVEHLWQGVTSRTKVIFLSHITSPTALIIPIAEVCRRAREAGILTVIDGAHAPGQIPVDMQAIDADFYTGNCHKWLSAPKGAGFLYARSETHDWLTPLVVSWGYYEEAFAQRNQWQGTRDITPFLTVPAAIEFQREHNWDSVREQCHQLAVETRHRIIDFTGLPPIAPEGWFAQMFTARLPECDVKAVGARLYAEFGVEVPVLRWNDQCMTRVSIQGYNTQEDLDALLEGFKTLLNL